MPLLLGGQGVCWIRQSSTLGLAASRILLLPPIPHYFSQGLFAFENQTLGHHFGAYSRQHELVSVFNSFWNLDIVYFILKNLKSVALSFL